MDNGWMVFGKVVGLVVGCFAPMNAELVLANAITDLVEMHVHGFGVALFDSVIGNAGSRVVCVDDHGQLRVLHLK